METHFSKSPFFRISLCSIFKKLIKWICRMSRKIYVSFKNLGKVRKLAMLSINFSAASILYHESKIDVNCWKRHEILSQDTPQCHISTYGISDKDRIFRNDELSDEIWARKCKMKFMCCLRTETKPILCRIIGHDTERLVTKNWKDIVWALKSKNWGQFQYTSHRMILGIAFWKSPNWNEKCFQKICK